jgi:hypothetical protein
MRRCRELNGGFNRFLRLVRRTVADGSGSFTPIQLTNTRTFDQLFTWLAS